MFTTPVRLLLVAAALLLAPLLQYRLSLTGRWYKMLALPAVFFCSSVACLLLIRVPAGAAPVATVLSFAAMFGLLNLPTALLLAIGMVARRHRKDPRRYFRWGNLAPGPKPNDGSTTQEPVPGDGPSDASHTGHTR